MARGKYFKTFLLLTFDANVKRSENSIDDLSKIIDDREVKSKPIPKNPNTIKKLKR